MKYILFLLYSILFCTNGTCKLDAGDNTAGLLHHYYKESLTELNASGRVTLEGTRISGPLNVNGSVSAQDASLDVVSINGQISFSNTTVNGKCDISGFLAAEKTTFKKKIEVAAQKVNFQDCTLESIYIRKTAWPFGKQVVTLNNTTCKGGIVFESGNGYVLLSQNSKVLGKIEGAEVAKTLHNTEHAY